MRILIVTGGSTSERKISLMSAAQVKKGLEETGHIVKLFDLRKGHKELKKLAKDFDVSFPVLHGEEGEGGNLQKFLSTLGKPFVGGDPKGFKNGWFKIPFKKFCDQNKILTAPWKKIKNEKDILKFGFPAVLKSSNGGSSREVAILKSAKDLRNTQCQKLLKSNLELFVEMFLPGTEVTVGILNNQALPVIEIVPPANSWFDYKNKYSGATQEIPDAPSLDENLKKIVQKIALQIHQSFDLGHYSRIDFIIYDKKPYVLEVNTIPGLTSQSLFPKAAQAVGISFPQLLDKMIRVAHEAKISKEISFSKISSPETKEIIETMLKIAYGEQKDKDKPVMVGLAAPQIGISKRIILVDVATDGKGKVGDLKVYINPEIIWQSKKEVEWYEGCYSTGKICGIVSRSNSIIIKASNIVEEKYTGYVARIFQHEIDHLDGKIFIDCIKNPNNLHWVEPEEFPTYRNKQAWKTWPKKASLNVLKYHLR